jgi:hypothetical protein
MNSRKPYEPVEDIPDIETSSINIKTFDPQVYEVIEATRFAIRHPANLKKRNDYDRELVGFLDSHLTLFKLTHGSLRVLLGHAYRKKHYPTVADATSLCREQVEKVFNVALLLNNPDKWVKRSLRSSWKTDYEGLLLEGEEQADNPRFKEFLTKYVPEYVEKTRNPPTSKRKREVIVSKLAMRAVKYSWDYPGSKKPKWLKYKGGIPDYLRDYFEFLTPGKAARTFKNQGLRRLLFRWHKEYTFMSQYAHAAMGKMVLPVIYENKSVWSQEQAEIYGKKLAERTIITSHLAIATSCALILNSVTNTYGAKDQLRETWDKLTGMALPARAYWNIHVNKLLKK